MLHGPHRGISEALSERMVITKVFPPSVLLPFRNKDRRILQHFKLLYRTQIRSICQKEEAQGKAWAWLS